MSRRVYVVLLAILIALAGTIVVLLAGNEENGAGSATGLDGSGAAATQSRAVPSFTAIELAGSGGLTVAQALDGRPASRTAA